MAQIAKMELHLEIRSSAERFYNMLRSKQCLFPKICPEVFKDVNAIKGDWESVGSIKQWTYLA
ncbi:Bet v I/Major latex protein, partial [Trema orientale]